MKVDKYLELRRDLLKEAEEITIAKGKDYTQGDSDMLKNFKYVAERVNMKPEQVLGIYMMKHQDSISAFIKHGTLESEPLKYRIIDNINYLLLLYTMYVENSEPES